MRKFPKNKLINTYNQAYLFMDDKTKQVKFGIKWKRKIRFSKIKKKGKSQSPKSSTLVKKRNLLKATFYH